MRLKPPSAKTTALDEAEPEPTPTPRSVWPLVLGLGALVLISGAGAFYLLSGSKDSGEVKPPPPITEVTAGGHELAPSKPPVEVAPPPAPKVTTVTLHVKTSPAGAVVYDESNARVGQAPFDLTREVDSVLSLKFVLKGYKDHQEKVRFVSSQVFSIELEKEPVVKHHPTPGPRPDISGNPYDTDTGNDLKPLPE